MCSSTTSTLRVKTSCSVFVLNARFADNRSRQTKNEARLPEPGFFFVGESVPDSHLAPRPFGTNGPKKSGDPGLDNFQMMRDVPHEAIGDRANGHLVAVGGAT